jgi:4-hydroxybenzoate polyprenyltransferase
VATDTTSPAPPARSGPQRRAERRISPSRWTPVQLLQAAHPRQALLTAAGIAGAAALAGRTTREVGLVLLTVLVGQAVLGWHNDLVDRRRDARHERQRKPVAQGVLDPGTVWFALACGVLLVIPLSVANGVTAGSAYLLALAVGLLANVLLRKGLLSWLPWAVQFALYPAFLSYGGWGGQFTGDPPEISVTVLAALLGIGVHVLRALPGLVDDNEDGYRHLPLRIALRIGATRLLVIASVYTTAVVVALLLAGNAVGLSQ